MADAARLLSAAFQKSDCKSLRLYIKKGHDCKAQQQEQPHFSLLHLTASLKCIDCDKVKIVQSLVKSGAATDARASNGMTPFDGGMRGRTQLYQ
jgi:hypothetical protein